MDDLIIEFIAESREGLEALDSELVRFERNPDDPELLGGVFRLIHTIKGACGFLGLNRLQTVAHAAENVLGAFRGFKEKMAQGPEPAVRKSVFPVPEGPGLGLDLNEDWLRSHLAPGEKWWA